MTQSPSTGPPTYHGSWWWSIRLRLASGPRQSSARRRDAPRVIDAPRDEDPDGGRERERGERGSGTREAPQAPARERAEQRQDHDELAPAEPRAGDGGGEEGRREDRGGAYGEQEAGGDLDVGLLAHHAGQAFAARAYEQPHRDQSQRAHRRPQQQALGRPDPQPHESRPALEVRGHAVGAGRALALGQHGVGRQPAVEAIVDRDEEHGREERDLDADEPGQAALAASRPAEDPDQDDQRRRDEAHAEPGQRRQQQAGPRRQPRQ